MKDESFDVNAGSCSPNRGKLGCVEMVAVRQQGVAQWCENARLIAAEVVGEDQIQRRPRFQFVFVMPV